VNYPFKSTFSLVYNVLEFVTFFDSMCLFN